MKHSNRKQKGISTIVIVTLLALIFLIVDIVLYSILTKSTKHTTDTTASKTSTTTTEQTASSTSESVTEESITLPDYKSAYYSIINDKKADNDSYSMTLEYCNVKDTPDSTWIEDRIQYIASDPYGIDGGKNFTLYLPGTFVQSLPEMYVGWVYNLEKNTTLSGFGLYNTETQDGFYAY